MPAKPGKALLYRSVLGLSVLAGALALLHAAGIWRPTPTRDRPHSARRHVRRYTAPRAPFIDDSGFMTVKQFWWPLKDPTSLEEIRDNLGGAARRAIAALEGKLNQPGLAPGEAREQSLQLALLYMYEGDFTSAARVLEKTRALTERDPDAAERSMPTLIFLQGVAALRRGETENCVECGCVSSCIFPIQPEAVHRKPEGSRQAIRFFTEYLEDNPEDIGVRWLLNVAHMTLGEYPDGVPSQYRIPLAPFQSEFDIGRFTDVAPQLGVARFSQAGGAILDDFDNDGLLDIVTSTMDFAGSMAFFRNKGDGTFEDRTKAAGLEGQLGGLYCVQTDYNNDGRLDLYVCRGAWTGVPQRHSLLRNNGNGTFTDVTREAGLLTPVCGQVAAWADYDNDGWLDLFVGSEVGRSRLYRNRHDGTFEEVAEKAGVACAGVFCKGASWGDFDGDGHVDLYVANLEGPPRLFRNNGNGTFMDVADRLGISRPTQGFSCWFWDYDNDGWPDLFATSYTRSLNDSINSHLGRPTEFEPCRLYRNRGGRGFEDVTAAVGLDKVMAPMGSNFGDLDNDGYLDFYLATGDPKYSTLVPNRLFKNVGGKRFADITVSSGTGHLQKGHAVACGDWDRDGNVDLFVEVGGATPGDRFRSVLFQNPGHDNHWITVKLVGKKTNRPAIGARIKLTLSGDSPAAVCRHVTSGSSFGGNPFPQTIGIGKNQKIETLEVYWPASRTTQVFRDMAADQAIEVTEFEPTYRRLGWTRVPFPR